MLRVRTSAVPYVSVCYMPLNHLAGRYACMRSILLGGATSFLLASDMSTLFEDIRIARPTALLLVPRIASAIHQHFLTELVRRSTGCTPEDEQARKRLEVVPDMRALDAYLEQRGGERGDAAVEHLIRGELDRIAAVEHLNGWEIPRAFLLEREPFSTRNGLLTESNKPALAKLRALYVERLDALYAEIERAQREELKALHQRDGASPAERARKAIEATLGLRDLGAQQMRSSFLQLGGDSISAANVSSLLHDACGVDVPVSLVLSPARSVEDIMQYVESSLAGATSARNLTFQQAHGAGAQVIRAADLRVDRFLGPGTLDAAAQAANAAALPPQARTVLLTGANGFLGRFLLLELLKRAPRDGGAVVCVVRAPGDSAAFERLSAAFEGDPALRERFQDLAKGGRLRALAGDLIAPKLGLADARYEELCEEVDSIVHNGALVHHALSYAQLFEPNVLGTVEVMRLALARRIKAIGFVSSVSVASISAADHRRPGYAIYHAVNPYRDDGVSLDTFVDWIQSAGYEVERVEEYARWFQAFRERLDALPPAQKQRSPLPILHQWERPVPSDREMAFDAERLQQRLRQLAADPGAGGARGIPHLSQAYIHKCLRDMVALGLIEAAAPAEGGVISPAA